VLYNNSTSWNINIAQDAVALGKRIGWKVDLVTLNFTTDPTGLNALQQAIALHPDAIIPPAVSPNDAGQAFLAAKAQGIPIVSAASLGAPGKDLQYGVRADVQLPPHQQATALVDYATANSGGCPRLIEWYTSQFAVAQAKGDAFQEAAQACKTCTLLAFDNDITAMETASGTEDLMTSWLEKYGSQPFYASVIADSNWDAAIPGLKAANASKSTVHLMGSDGSVSSYQRISTGDYEVASTFMSADEQIWTLFDDLNRIFHGQQPTTFNPRLLLVTHQNIKSALGPTSASQYEPRDGYQAHFLKIWGVK
jgi:ribose transport system substrate-binding protein